MKSLFAQYAYLQNTWHANVRIYWNEKGVIQKIETAVSAAARTFDEKQVVYLLPGMVNLHSHAFQRAMAGRTEFAGGTKNNFWSWRDVMYRFALAIKPSYMYAIAQQLYSECLRHGYTSVCEFHYLHRDEHGQWYQDKAEMAKQLIDAAQQTGIGITLLPVLYSYADLGGIALQHEQRRFQSNVDDILQIVESCDALRSAHVEIGVAPHSLRATHPSQIQAVMQQLDKNRPLHIHIAEQMREVNQCLQVYGKRPVQYLLDEIHIDQRWCLVHATHLDEDETRRLAQSGAVAGICPSTEANLGDGFFHLSNYLQHQGHWGIGTDSHASQSVIEELRWLEYGQRLKTQTRNVAHTTQQSEVADVLWQQSLIGGELASGRKVGRVQENYAADFVVLDETHPNLACASLDKVLSTWLFAGNDNVVRDVYVAGKQVVENYRHVQQDAIQAQYYATMRLLAKSA